MFPAPRTTDSAQFRRPGPCREKRELGKEPQIGVVFGTPGTTDLRRVQRKLRNKRPRQPFGFKKMHGNQTYPSSLSVLNRQPLLAQTKGRRACVASRRPWINPGSRFRLAAPRHAAAGPIEEDGANGSVGKNKGGDTKVGDTTTRTEQEGRCSQVAGVCHNHRRRAVGAGGVCIVQPRPCVKPYFNSYIGYTSV